MVWPERWGERPPPNHRGPVGRCFGEPYVIILFCFWLGRSSFLRQSTLDNEVASTEQFSDSVLVENRILNKNDIADSLEIEELKQDTAILIAEYKDLRRRYNSVSYKLKVSMLESVVGGDVVVHDNLVCLNESQIDSVNILSMDKDECLEVLEIAKNVINLKDEIINSKQEQIINWKIIHDTTVVEITQLRNIYQANKKDKKKIKRNRRFAIGAVLVAVLEGWLLSLSN